jgi:hypothetical protein
VVDDGRALGIDDQVMVEARQAEIVRRVQ